MTSAVKKPRWLGPGGSRGDGEKVTFYTHFEFVPTEFANGLVCKKEMNYRPLQVFGPNNW